MKNVESRLVQAVILLDRQRRLIDRLIETQSAVLKTFEQSCDAGKAPFDQALDVYNYAYGLIDHLARFQKISASVPALSQKSLEYRRLVAALGAVKDARDQLQHINNDIENSNTGPLMGAVFWVSDARQYMALLSDVGRNRSAPGIPFDTVERRFVSNFCFVYGEVYYDLQKAIEGIREYANHVMSIVRIETDGSPYSAAAHYVAVVTSFELDVGGSESGSSNEKEQPFPR